jgi:hypothetical protein
MDRGKRGSCYLSGQLVEHNCNKLMGKLEVGGLEDMVGSVEDNERIARNVGLQARRTISTAIYVKENLFPYDNLLSLPRSCCYSLEPSLRSAGKYSSHRARRC